MVDFPLGKAMERSQKSHGFIGLSYQFSWTPISINWHVIFLLSSHFICRLYANDYLGTHHTLWYGIISYHITIVSGQITMFNLTLGKFHYISPNLHYITCIFVCVYWLSTPSAIHSLYFPINWSVIATSYPNQKKRVSRLLWVASSQNVPGSHVFLFHLCDVIYMCNSSSANLINNWYTNQIIFIYQFVKCQIDLPMAFRWSSHDVP